MKNPLATRWWPLACYATCSGLVMTVGWYLYLVKGESVYMVALTVVAMMATAVALTEKDPERMRLWRMAQVIHGRHNGREKA